MQAMVEVSLRFICNVNICPNLQGKSNALLM